MKLLVSIAAMVLLACQAEKCDEVSVLAFTHVQYNQLTLYKQVKNQHQNKNQIKCFSVC